MFAGTFCAESLLRIDTRSKNCAHCANQKSFYKTLLSYQHLLLFVMNFYSLLMLASFVVISFCLLEYPSLLIGAYRTSAFTLFVIKLKKNTQFRESNRAKWIYRTLLGSYIIQAICLTIVCLFNDQRNVSLFESLGTLAVQFLESPKLLVYPIEICMILLSFQFRKSPRAKLVLQVVMLMFSIQFIHACCVLTGNMGESQVVHSSSSLYYQEQADYAFLCGAQPENSTDIPESSSSGLDSNNALGEDDEFHYLCTWEQMMLKTNAALKAVSELKENKTLDYKPAGADWIGERIRAQYWRDFWKEADNNNCSVLGLCRSDLPLETLLGREEVEEAVDPAAGENLQEAALNDESGFQYSKLPWKKVVAFTTVAGMVAYSVYKGEIPSQIVNWIPQQVKTACASYKGVVEGKLQQIASFKLKK